MKKFFRFFVVAQFIGLICLINQATIYAVQLTVDTGAAGAKVSALNFDSMRNPSPNSVFDLTDATGKAVLNIAANTDYVVFATKQGKGPSLREQVMMGRAVPVRTSGDMTISLQLNETISNVGTINIGLLNVSTGAPVVGDIRNVTTNEPVSFIMNFMDSSLAMANTNYISAFNIPAAPGNTYIVNIFSPNQNKGMNKQVAESLAADGQVTVNFDFSSQEAMAAQTQDTGITPEGNIAFEGVVVDTNSKGIADMNVQLYSQAPDTFQPKNDFFAMTDSNGRFAFYNIPADSNYYLNINGLGYAGANDGPRANGPNGPISGYTYNGTNKIVVPSVPVLPVGYNYEYCYGLTNSQYKLPAVNGRLKGVVTVGNPPVALPFANVQIWGDGDRWAGTDMFSSSSMTWSNTSSPTNARIRTGADGTFDIIGLSNGNISLGIWSDLIGINYIYNYKGDWNARNMDTTTGFRGGDDVRVSISTVPQLNNGANETTPLWCVYYASGVPIAGSTATVVINIQTEGTAACTIKGTIKFLEAANIPPTNPLVIIAREQFQGDWSTHKSKSRFIGISGTFAKGATKTYDIPVSAGTQYWVDVKSEYWGIVNRFDTQADFSNVTSGEKVLDFALAPAGKIRGVVRLPDGTIFKPVNSNTGGRWIRIKANSRVSGGDGQVPDSGVFEITGLIPGLYNITTWGDGSGYTWPKSVIITDVMVSPNRETYIEIPLTNGVKCEAIAPPYPMPAMAAGTSGYYTIAGFNSDDILTGQKLDALMDSDSETPIGFNYNTSTYTSWGVQSLGWQPTIAAPGRYNLYLIKYEMFVGRPSQDIGDGMMGSEHETFTVISQAKNVEIKYDPLQPNATTYIPFEGAVTGKGKITGKITGTNIWTSSDYEKAKKEGGKTMLKNMPTVMLYDLNGTWRGFSGARPKNDPVSIAPWEIFSVNPNETTKQKGMKDSPFYYYVDMLPPGKYIMIAETPNYPPFIKEVLIYSTATTTLDLDFDASVGSGLSISGVVTSTDTGISLEGAEVVINHKSVSKYTVTDANGAYSIAGLPKGIYRISVSKSGYALSGDKIGLGESLTGKNFQLTKGDSAITGAVYSQKIPFAKTLANAKIACYDETYNTQNKTKYLPVNKAKTDKNGNYYISGLISGHIYKVYVMATGKIVEYVEVTPVAGDNTQDFELKSLPPKLKIIVKKTENPRKYLFMFSSPKKLVAPPECWYNSGDSYDVNKAIQALPLSGPNNTYSLYVNLLETNINQNYNLRVISDDGGKKNTDDIKFGGNVKRQAKKDVAEGIAEGDDVAIDELGDDNTQIGLDAGSLIPSEATASDSPGRGAPSFAIGGFSSNIPSFQLQGTDSSLATELINVDESAVAGDVYQVDLSNSQMNKSVTLSLNYDKEKVSETDIDKLKIYQYNSDKRVWELVPGNKTIDPVSGTVSIDVESITDAVNSTSTTRLSGRAVIQNGRFVVNRAASTSQSGTFAVFKKAPPTGVAWSGDFTMFNFPNPFHLKDKTVTLVNPGGIADTNSILAGTNLSTKGTIIKYCLPAGRTGDVKIFIYNLAGELVRELDDGVRDAGYIYYVDWDGRNDRDDECASGVYFALLKVGTKTLNKGKPLKLAIIK